MTVLLHVCASGLDLDEKDTDLDFLKCPQPTQNCPSPNRTAGLLLADTKESNWSLLRHLERDHKFNLNLFLSLLAKPHVVKVVTSHLWKDSACNTEEFVLTTH